MRPFIQLCTTIRPLCIALTALTLMAETLTAQPPSGSEGELLTLTGHQGYVSDISFSPDGQKVVTTSYDGTAKIWDAYTGDLLLTLKPAVDLIYASAIFSPDGRYIATGGSDSTVRLFDAGSGAPVRTLIGHPGVVISLRFSRDGALLVTCGEGKMITVWSPPTGELIRTIKGHTDEVMNVRFSPDESRIVSNSMDGTVRIWDLNTGKGMSSFQPFFALTVALDLSPDGSLIAVSSFQMNEAMPGMFCLLQTSTGNRVRTMWGNKGSAEALSFSSDGRMLAISGGMGPIRILHVETGDTMFEHGDVESSFSRIIFSPAGDRVGWTERNTTNAYIWRLPTLSSAAPSVHESVDEELICFPNPATNIVELSYMKRSPGLTRIVLHNAMGETVAVMENNDGDPGRASCRFNVEGLPSGSYFCSIRTENGVASVPVQIVR